MADQVYPKRLCVATEKIVMLFVFARIVDHLDFRYKENKVGLVVNKVGCHPSGFQE